MPELSPSRDTDVQRGIDDHRASKRHLVVERSKVLWRYGSRVRQGDQTSAGFSMQGPALQAAARANGVFYFDPIRRPCFKQERVRPLLHRPGGWYAKRPRTGAFPVSKDATDGPPAGLRLGLRPLNRQLAAVVAVHWRKDMRQARCHFHGTWFFISFMNRCTILHQYTATPPTPYPRPKHDYQ